jgi:hypothetical protein
MSWPSSPLQQLSGRRDAAQVTRALQACGSTLSAPPFLVSPLLVLTCTCADMLQEPAHAAVGRRAAGPLLTPA